tara:strand:+ start:184 stop:555 length:372 start_codon:yes stop_codon:yes gene_type:complete
MKAKELRIGNWVNIESLTDGSDLTEQCELFHLQEMSTSCKYQYKPIPLTEEWLLKFGFISTITNGEKGYYKKFDQIEDFEISRKIGYEVFYIETKFNIVQINNLHQLQNLYFALTGEELTIKK